MKKDSSEVLHRPGAAEYLRAAEGDPGAQPPAHRPVPPLKDGITALGWVLVAYMGYWYLGEAVGEGLTGGAADMERSGQDERNQFLWGQAAYFSWQVTLAAIAAMAVVMSVLDCTAGILAAAVLFGVHMLSYFVQLSRLSQKF